MAMPASATPVIRDPRAEFDKAVALRAQGNLAAARTIFERMLAAYPNHLGLLGNVGVIAWEQGDLQAAHDRFRRAAELDPGNAERHQHLGTILLNMKSWERAAEAFQVGTRLAPGNAMMQLGLGTALRSLERWDEAASALLRAIALDPSLSDAHDELGIVLIARGEFSPATEALREAIRLAPDSPAAWHNLGSLMMKSNQPQAAAQAFSRALALRPGDPDLHVELGTALLQQGDFAAGWRAYEHRFQGSFLAACRRPDRLPRWNGAATPRTLLLHAEQGFGDTLQFVRYAPLVAARGHDVVLEVQSELVELLALSFADPAIRVVARAAAYPGLDGLPPVDAHCPLMSLPLVFGTRLETIPATPYLKADPARIAAWTTRLDGRACRPHGGLRVGVVWAGNPRPGQGFAIRETDARRSLPLATLAPLFALPGLSFVSLQKGEAAQQLRDMGFAEIYDADGELGSFADTAALIANLDLVISVDTSVAHLAGGMGKPVWLLSRFDGCWRWLQDRDDSPWYPSMRIFRQDSGRDWESVVDEVRAALAAHAAP